MFKRVFYCTCINEIQVCRIQVFFGFEQIAKSIVPNLISILRQLILILSGLDCILGYYFAYVGILMILILFF